MYFQKKRVIAMLLAGGQGSRLHVLTRKTAKPAVPFGGKYRIIDFPLSNCVNSGIDTVGILTQYQPLELNTYIGNGSPWDLDRNHGGVYVLPPYQSAKAGEWYKGTANAIYQNMHFMKMYNPEYILILSGDHIYKMDYDKMLKKHIESNAEATIAVIEVAKREASRFGIMNTDETNRIIEFEEKPANPKSNYAVPGLYFYDNSVVQIAQNVKPSARGEIEITTVNNTYLEKNALKVELLGRGMAWLDTGTYDGLLEASNFIATIEKRQGMYVSCIEEIAYYNGWISKDDLLKLASTYKTEYGEYLKYIAEKE